MVCDLTERNLPEPEKGFLLMSDTWPPKPSSPLPEAVPPKPIGPEGVLSFVIAALLGAGLYFASIYFVSTSSPLKSVVVGRLGIVAMILLCNCVPIVIFFCLRRAWFYVACGFAWGSVFLSVLFFLYTLRMWFLPRDLT